MLNQAWIRVLWINMTKQSFRIEERKDLSAFLGGVGVGIKLLEENLDPSWETFDERQPIIFSIGPMETIYPVVTKVAALFRSPLTGELGESYAGLRLGMAMRFAGYDAIVIQGKARVPTYLSIDHDGVNFHNATALWGMDTEETGRLLREIEPGEGLRSIIRIGPSGERLVRFAGVNVDTYRHFGRLGLGSLFGSKQLKGIVVYGNGSLPLEQPKDFNQVYSEIYQKVTQTDVMEKYHDIGTSINVMELQRNHSLPTKNLQQSRFEYAQEISGEAFAEELLMRKMACAGCPIGCIHIALYKKKFGDSHEYAYSGISYDYELIFALGSFLGIKEKEGILSLIEEVERSGLDIMTTGVLLGWITEAFEKKLITEREIGCKISFGDVEGYKRVIRGIVEGESEFYQHAKRGTNVLASRYGGLAFAAVLGKHEMAGYHTGYGNLLGMSVGARHSHLDNGGYAIDQGMKELDKEKLVDTLLQEEIERNIVNCLVICLFARKVYDLDTILSALRAIGIEKSKEDLLALGKEIFRLKVQLKKKLGFDYGQVTFPKRFFETQTYVGKLEESTAKELLEMYIEKMEQV